MKTTKGKIISIVLATVTGFVVSAIWYTLFGPLWQQLRDGVEAIAAEEAGLGVMLGEIVRTFILACVLTYFVLTLEIKTLMQTVSFGIVVWVGFPFIILLGSVLHENVHPGIAAIHIGDWLVKLMAMLSILSIRYKKHQTSSI